MIRPLTFAVSLCLAGLPARAELAGVELAGAEAPALRAALALWLAGEEEAALPAMADQARAGNAAAQVMIALIDMTAAYQGDWLGALPRAERIALMRRPGGISGESWLAVAEGALAQAWRRLLDTETGPAVVTEFADMGEDRAAVFAARTLKRRQNRELAAAMAEPGVPDYLATYGGGEWLPAPDDPAWAPVSAACANLCAGDAPACAIAVQEALGGDLHLAGPPASQIVPPADWAASAMAQSSLLRMVSTSGWRGEGPACLMGALPD